MEEFLNQELDIAYLEEDALSLCDLQIHEEPDVSPRHRSFSSPSPHFEFSSDLNLHPDFTSENIMFCGKIVGRDSNFTPESITRNQSIAKEFIKTRSNSSIGVVDSSISKSRKKQLVLIGIAKVPERMELSEIRKRQSRRTPVAMFPKDIGDSPEAFGEFNGWGSLRCLLFPFSCRAEQTISCSSTSSSSVPPMEDGEDSENGSQNHLSDSECSELKDFLETSKAERAMWLMKCPPVVARCFQTPLDDSSRPVSKITLSIDPLRSNDDDDSSSPQFAMELSGTEFGHAPKTYSMNMSKDFISVSVFSESSQGKLSVEGKVLNKFDMKPSSETFENYGKLCRERTSKYMKKTRQIQVIENDNGARMRPMPGMLGLAASGMIDKKKMAIKGSDMKRTRRDRTEMEEIMFKLFERQPNWTLRNLVVETDQPEQFLKDILKDLCIYNNKGANQGTYELKPEYRKLGVELKPEYI